MFSARKPKCSRRFGEIYPEILHTCSMSPCRPVDERCFVFLCFSPGIWDFLRANFFFFFWTTKYLAKKTHSHTVWERVDRGSCNTCAKIQDLSRKRRELPTLHKFGPFNLNQPGMCFSLFCVRCLRYKASRIGRIMIYCKPRARDLRRTIKRAI